jgi:hypothetical protein
MKRRWSFERERSTERELAEVELSTEGVLKELIYFTDEMIRLPKCAFCCQSSIVVKTLRRTERYDS